MHADFLVMKIFRSTSQGVITNWQTRKINNTVERTDYR